MKLALLLLLAFGGLMLCLQLKVGQDFDRTCSMWLCDWGGVRVTHIAKIFARVGSTGLYLTIPLLAGLGWICGKAPALKLYLCLLVGHCCLLGITKFTVARPRPDSASLQTHLDSFPSGHTLIALIMAGSFLLFVLPHCRNKWQCAIAWAVAVAWPFLMGLSRIQMGRHYVADVLGSWLLGTAWILLCATLMRWNGKPAEPA